MAATSDSVQQAHDYLRSQIAASGGTHSCPLCSSAGIESAKEETPVDENRYSESQHLALLESAVARETAAVTAAKEEAETALTDLTTQKADLETRLSESEARIGVLEAEKASAEASAEAARAEFAEYKAEQVREAEIAERREARAKRVKAANANLDDAHFTEERIGRWAEMNDDAFEAVVAAYEAGSTAAPKKEQAAETLTRESSAFKGGESGGTPESTGTSVGSWLTRRWN